MRMRAIARRGGLFLAVLFGAMVPLAGLWHNVQHPDKTEMRV